MRVSSRSTRTLTTRHRTSHFEHDKLAICGYHFAVSVSSDIPFPPRFDFHPFSASFQPIPMLLKNAKTSLEALSSGVQHLFALFNVELFGLQFFYNANVVNAQTNGEQRRKLYLFE